MATNPYFRLYTHEGEQNLVEDLIVECIRIHAHDMYYLPRTGIKRDDLINEFSFSQFNSVMGIELYVKNFDSFEGEGELLSKFGLEIRNQMTLVMSIRSFNEFIHPHTRKSRPEEGDCIYIPMLGTMYQVKYVSTSAIFYTLGKLNTYEITCELLEYSNEEFNTGMPEIDDKYQPFQNADDNAYDLTDYDLDAGNADIQTVSDDVLDFSETSPFNTTNE